MAKFPCGENRSTTTTTSTLHTPSHSTLNSVHNVLYHSTTPEETGPPPPALPTKGVNLVPPAITPRPAAQPSIQYIGANVGAHTGEQRGVIGRWENLGV